MTAGLFELGKLTTRTNADEYIVAPPAAWPPVQLGAALRRYIDLALKHAKTEYLEDDQEYYSEIPGFAGVYATGDSQEVCARALRDVLEGWIVLRLAEGRSFPAVSG